MARPHSHTCPLCGFDYKCDVDKIIPCSQMREFVCLRCFDGYESATNARVTPPMKAMVH